VETIEMIHFVMGANSSLINEFPFTQVGPFERFMKWQRKNNPHMVAQDEDLQRVIVK
jgi:hypothetical protein